MIIQHNIMALNAHRQLGGNNSLVSKNLEKLSSGFRINRAGDDAAGLAISEKMRAQITGLNRAQSNAQDGISLVQTAEGALTEVHSMLNRMVDLATQSSNGTMQADDRQKIQDEMDALVGEIDRISQSTNFNGINLLDGKLGGNAPGVTISNGGEVLNGKEIAAVALTGKTDAIGATNAKAAFTYKAADGSTKTLAFDITASATSANEVADKLNADSDFSSMYTAKKDATTNALVITAKKPGVGVAADVKFTFHDTTATAGANNLTNATAGAFAKTEVTLAKNLAVGDSITIGGRTYTMAAAKNDTERQFTSAAELAAMVNADGVVSMTAPANLNAGTTITFSAKSAGQGLTLQIGDTAETFNKVTVAVDDMGAQGLGISGLKVTDQDVAAASIKTIKAAINTVSKNRSAMGALQNRLEHTINNLSVATENMTAAESRIRDVDMAKEMMHFTKNNVLSQAAQAMLAQANQQPQQVLQLLR